MKFLADILETAQNAGGALVPAALGSAIGQAFERGMAWRDRLLAYLSGIVVSYYVTLGAKAWLHFNDFVGQSIGFVIAMIAYKATPRFIAGVSEALGSLPGTILERALEWLPRRKVER